MIRLSELLSKPREIRRRERVPVVRTLLVELDPIDVPTHKRGEYFHVRIAQQFVVTSSMAYQPQPLNSLRTAYLVGQRGPNVLARVLLPTIWSWSNSRFQKVALDHSWHGVWGPGR